MMSRGSARFWPGNTGIRCAQSCKTKETATNIPFEVSLYHYSAEIDLYKRGNLINYYKISLDLN
jgi:hypothetical protein